MSVIHGLILKMCLLRSSREFVILTEEIEMSSRGSADLLSIQVWIKDFFLMLGSHFVMTFSTYVLSRL